MKNHSRRRCVFYWVLPALLWVGPVAGIAATNPLPMITGPLVPASVQPGSSSFTLTVNGSGFVVGSVIYWNNLPLKTTLVSRTQLTATISSAQVKSAATVSVTVVNPAPGGGSSNAAFLQITSTTTAAAFSGGTSNTGLSPLAIVAADFRSNGYQDLAVANDLGNTVSILLGNNDGTFQSQVAYATGLGPEDVAAGDLNSDGELDLVVVDALADTVSILLGNGDGTFHSHADYATGLGPARVALGDFNGDGILDLAVSNQLAATVSVLLGNGDGTFQTHTDYAVGEEPIGLVVCDFNGDDIPDLAVANFALNTVSLLSGNGDGTFQSPLDSDTAAGPVDLVAADFNGDGIPDLVVADLIASQISFLAGEGNNSFAHHVDYNTGLYPESIATGDYNGDGLPDLALPTDDTLGSVSVMLGKGGGIFGKAADFPSGLLPVSIASADFNADGRLDVATANENVNSASALLGTTALLSPASIEFNSQNLGTTSNPQSITLTNLGSQSLSISTISATLPFAESDNCGNSLAGSASCTVNVTFTPTLPGTANGTLSVSDDAAGTPQWVRLSGTGTGPTASLSPTYLNFGSVDVGSVSAAQTVTLSNNGNATLNINSVTVTGDFVAYNFCQSTLAAGKNCPINVAFKPTASGTRTGVLSVSDNALGSPQTVSLTGVGLAPVVILNPSSLTFGTQPVNTVSAPQPVTLMNTGTAPLTISSIITGSSFVQTNNCGGTVNAGASCTINVAFSPTGPGPRNGSVKVYDNAPGNPQSIACTGTGTVILLLPPSLNFGTVKVGKSSTPRITTLTNLGTTSINITSVTLTGADADDFSQTNTCGRTVGPFGSCIFTVTFKPEATGSRTASLSISDNGGASPQTVPLSGTGN